MIVALTGSIGSGKSQLAEVFKKLGATIIDADQLAREVVATGTPGLKLLVDTFGKDITESDGSLNRQLLGSMIFSDSQKKTQVEKILHPLIRELFLEKLALTSKEDKVLAVIPLLVEAKDRYPEIEKVIVVTADEDACIQRIQDRDSCSRELATAKYNSQASQAERLAIADYVVQNDSTIKDLETKAEELFKKVYL